jgi:PIN domain nuclease of toxin-antitoxin system
MILLDTCTLLWLVADQDKLSTTAIQALRNNAGKIFVSAISAFEIGVKWKKGLLLLPLPPAEWFSLAIVSHGLTELPVTSSVAIGAILLPDHHNDPAARILIATAIENHLMILTPDKHIHAYPAKVLW